MLGLNNSHDKANRLTEILFADGTKHTFGYDAAGNMTSYASPGVSGVIAYDAANRKTGESVTMGGFTKSFSYTYDSRGNKASFTSPDGTTYNYTYNRNGQPTQIATPVGNIALAYQWVRQTKLTLPNGVISDYSYNENSWLTNIAARKAPDTVFAAGYQFDKVGNITQKATDVTTNYGYDKIYQLLSATNSQNTEAFTYDKVGNRKTSAATAGEWSYNRNNELLSYNGTSFGYDANGNTVTKTEGTGSGTVPVPSTTTYVYGATDRLETVNLPDGRTATYTYDPFGRRVKKQVEGEVTYFVYADEGLIGEYDATGAFQKGYGWRPNGIWGTNPVFMVEEGEYYFYQNDHLGTPQTMTDVDGDVVWEASYSAFGQAKVGSISTVVNNLRFPGQYWDEETRLHYNMDRYYNVNGRYLQKDHGVLMKGFNEYSYAFGSPIKFFDANGLWPSLEPFNTHRHSIERVLSNVVSNDDLQMIIQSQQLADSETYQTPQNSHRHAMRGDNAANATEARYLMLKFIREQFEKAWLLRYKHRCASLVAFGLALHALQDYTTPTHHGFQDWTANEASNDLLIARHIRGELFDPGPGSELDRITRDAWDWYQQGNLPKGDFLNNYGADRKPLL